MEKAHGRIIAAIDTSDSNTVLVGPSGIGKTNFFLIPQIEYAAASGISFLVTDTKDGVLKNRIIFYEDEFGTLPPIPDIEMVFSASRSRNILSAPLI